MVSMSDWRTRAGNALPAKHPTRCRATPTTAVIPGLTRDPSVTALGKPLASSSPMSDTLRLVRPTQLKGVTCVRTSR
jgi:hypothetical protein